MKQNQQISFMLRTYFSFEKIQVRTKVLSATCLSLIFLFVCTFSSFSQCTLLNETFDVDPVLASSNTDGAWYPDRYRPAAFESDAGRLKISISSADGAQLRPGGFNSAFYNTQGRKFNQCGNCATVVKADLYIPSDWATEIRRSDMWATAYDASNAITGYPIIGFRNVTGSNPQMSIWNGSGWTELGPPSSYDISYTMEMRINGTDIEYLINNTIVGAITAPGSVYFGNIIMQAYNFNDNTLGASYDSNPLTNSYDAFWDNLITTGTDGKIVTNTDSGELFCSIQSAIDAPLTLNGHTLSVGAGTYNEAVTLSKSLTIEGATSDRTLYIIDGTGLPGANSGIRINNAITGSTIQNLTIQNFTGGGANTHGGIFCVGGNNNTSVDNVAISNNISAAGFYANGPVNNISVTNSLAQNHGPGARGIVLWNGLKSNITITGNTVTNNNCCGIEFQDGDASGVNVSNNIIDIGGGDNGIGIVGLNTSVGTNLIDNNTITGGGRYGIEIKNPAGGVTVSNNMVSLTTVNADLRDRVGIAVFRRGVLGGNVDVPNGVTVTGNTVNGYQQASSSEGFGIVIEGTNHVVTGNTVSNCDVGILEQQNPSGYPGDADQSNLADLFFGRGNSPFTCGNEISGNNFSGNSLDTRELGASEGIVTNTTTFKSFCSIQAAINDPQTLATHVLEVSSATYDEQVLVTKGVTIRGVGATQPIVDFTGTVTGKPTLFDVSVDGVTIENINFNVDLAKLSSAIIASAVTLDNISILDNVIDAYGTPVLPYGNRNAVSVNYGGPTNYRVASGGVNNITFTGNTVNGTLPTSFFRSGISTDESGGTFSNNTLQTINHDILVRFASNGAVNITNNDFNGGGVELADQNAAAGTLTVSGNTFTGAGAPGAAVLRIKNNYNTIPHIVSGNTFTDFEWAVSLENMNNITLDGNTFSSSSPTARAVVKNTKSISSNSSAIVQVPVYATLINNDFSGNGTALTFQNHDSDNDSYGTFNIGTVGNPNTFAATLTNFIVLDDQTGSTNGSTFPIYPITGQWETIMDCWATDLSIENNTYDVGSGQQSPLIMDIVERAALENKLYHNPDAACLGELFYFFPIHNVTQNTFHMTIQDAIDAVTTVDNDVIEVPAGTYNETLLVDKSLTINGSNSGINANEPLDITLINGARLAESVLSATIIQIAAQNVTLDGFKFIGAGGVRTDGLPANDADGLTIINNIFEDIPSPAYNNTAGAAAQSNIIFSLNRVDGNNTGAISAINAWEFINNMTISQNYFAEFERGIQLDNATSIDISNNYFTDITHQALQIANGCSMINVNQNVFDNCNIPAQSDRGAIRLYENVTGLISILNNEFTNNGNAVRVRAGGSFSHNHFVVQNNSFTSNTFGVSDGSIGSTEPINAQANWWGDVTGPSGAGSGTGDAVSSNVTFCPWLDGPLPTGMPINGGGLGEVKNTTTDVLYCSIQSALDASLIGEEIHFNGGTSTETISIDAGKKLVINMDATLTNNTTLTNNGTLEKIGAFNNNGVYTGFGTFIGDFVNTGTNRVGN